MKEDRAIRVQLERLRTTVSSMPSIVDGVMDRIGPMPAPVGWRPSIGRKAAVACTAAAACLAVIVGLAIVAGNRRQAAVTDTPDSRSPLPQRDAEPGTRAPAPLVVEDETPERPTTSVAYSYTDLAYVNSKWGFIDRTGQVVVEPKYSWAGDFGESVAPVKVGGTHFLGGKCGFVDGTGKMVIEPRFDAAKPFSEGRAAVRLDGKWGFIDHDGKLCVEPRFDWVWPFSEGLAAFKEGQKCGFVNRDGDVVIPPNYETVWDGFREGLAPVEITPEVGSGQPKPPRYGYIDPAGKIVIEPRFERAAPFSEGLAAVQIGQRWGFIDREGKVAIPAEFVRRVAIDGLLEFRDGRSIVQMPGEGDARMPNRVERFGVIDKTGRMVVAPRTMFDYGVRYLETDGRAVGCLEDPVKHEPASEPFDASRVMTSSEGLVKVWSGDTPAPVAGEVKYGFVDDAGSLVIEPRFEEVGDFSEGRAKFAVGLDWAAASRAMENEGVRGR